MVDTIKANPVLKFVSDNWFSIAMLSCAAAGIASIIGSAAQHREDVRAISVQNAGCIYLESSKLGEGQHYMICNGQITLKRLQDGETPDPEKALQEAIPAATNTATPTTSAATTK
jgi:hypothetical protein